MLHYRFFGITTSDTELKEMALAWFMLSLAFAVLFTRRFAFSTEFVESFVFSGATIGISFLLHELAHKIVAQRYGCFAEFRAFREMLILSLLLSFTGIILAAPGAVIISGYVSRIANGKIASAGVLMNLVLALFFFAGLIFISAPLLRFGLYINALLAVFNLLPFAMFDGAKIFAWDRRVWGIMLASSLVLMLLSKVY